MSENEEKKLFDYLNDEQNLTKVKSRCSSGELSPPIFKLTTDCCDEIFDYLSTKDLYSFGSTCKAMQKVAGEYFKRNCAKAEKVTKNDGIYTCYYDHDGTFNKRVLTSGFNRYITNLSYYYDRDTGPLHYIEAHSDELDSVNSLYLLSTRVDAQKVKYFQKILPKVEYVTIHQCTADANFYEVFLQFCENMTHLTIIDDLGCIISRKANPWLLNHYPKLKHLHLCPRHMYEIHELRTFFKQNPNVRSFSTTFGFLHLNRNHLINSYAQLERLIVENFKYHTVENMQVIFDLLKQLREKQFYKRLHLSLEQIDQQICDEMTFLPGLEKVRFDEYTGIYSLPRLINLKELHLPGGLTTNDIEVLAINLVNLEQITICFITSDDLLPFMRFSKNLRKVYAYLNGGILNLSKLNKERKKLVNARNVIIYVGDNIFLATKWTSHYGEMDLNLVEMRRIDSA